MNRFPPPYRARRRLNDMQFCKCEHGHAAHRGGFGACFGERMIRGEWTSCECPEFRSREPDEEQPDQPDES